MKKVVLITGATDGIGLATAKMMVTQGHEVLIHGRNAQKLAVTETQLFALPDAKFVKSYQADFSKIDQVIALADKLKSEHAVIDILINNAGVFKAAETTTLGGLDVRFVVNTIAPYIFTKALMPLLGSTSRVLNLSSAAQATVNLKALQGLEQLSDIEAYAQSKLAIASWTKSLAEQSLENPDQTKPIYFAVNPGSLLASKMVKEGFGVAGADINIGATILSDLAFSEDYITHSGQYFDNDAGQFDSGHSDINDRQKAQALVDTIEAVIDKLPDK